MTLQEPLNPALLIYMLDRAAPVLGRTKIQKAPFFVEVELSSSGQVASTFHYKRYHNGPFSQEVWDSLDYLVRMGFLRSADYGPTPRGLFLLDLVEMLRETNPDVFSAMDKALRYCKVRTGKQLMDAAYEIELEPDGMVPGKPIRLRDVPQNVWLIRPTSPTISVSDDLLALIRKELETDPSELEKAENDLPRLEREAITRLLEATPEGQPS